MVEAHTRNARHARPAKPLSQSHHKPSGEVLVEELALSLDLDCEAAVFVSAQCRHALHT